jgi:hypothetical protein
MKHLIIWVVATTILIVACDTEKDLRDVLSNTKWQQEGEQLFVEFTPAGKFIQYDYFSDSTCYSIDQSDYTVVGDSIFFASWGGRGTFTLEANTLTIGPYIYQRHNFDSDDLTPCLF